jgi:hypothetical protein
MMNDVGTPVAIISKYSDGRIRLQYPKYPIEFKNIKLNLGNH